MVGENLRPGSGANSNYKDSPRGWSKSTQSISPDHLIHIFQRVYVVCAVVNSAAEDFAVLGNRDDAVPVFNNLRKWRACLWPASKNQSLKKQGVAAGGKQYRYNATGSHRGRPNRRFCRFGIAEN